MPPIDPQYPFILGLRAGHKLENKVIDDPLELTLDTHPAKPFEFKDCIFEVSPTLPTNLPHHGHPTLVFDQCIFKKPLKLAKRWFHREVTFRECRFERYADFTDSLFLQGASFEDCSFDEKVYFEHAIFGIDPKEIASQPAEGSCEECHNNSIQLARLVQVCHPISRCPSTTVNSESQIQRSNSKCLAECASFHAAVFKDGAEFDYATFRAPACFYKATFYATTTFLKCQFPSEISFNYRGDACNRILVDKPIEILSLAHAQVLGSVEFNQSLRPSAESYGDGEISELYIHGNFQYIHVHGQHGLRFHTENLKCCSVLGTNLDVCHFSNVRWPKVKTYYPLAFRVSFAFMKSLGYTWFRASAGAGSKSSRCIAIAIRRAITLVYLAPFYAFHKILSWLVRFPTRWVVAHRSDDKDSARPSTFKEYCESCWTLEQYCIWDHKDQIQYQDKKLPNLKIASHVESEVSRWRNKWALLSRAYRDLKTAYEENKDYIYASDFHYAEKEFRRINYEVPRQTRIQLQLYWLVSGYGERVLRPIWWFLIICVLGAVPYYLWGQPKPQSLLSCIEGCGLKINMTAAANIMGFMPKLEWEVFFIGLAAVISFYWVGDTFKCFTMALLFSLVAWWTIGILAPFVSIAPVSQGVCFSESLRFSAETMGFLKPDYLVLGDGLTWLRIWSWAQTLIGPFLFVMFSLALKNKLKR